ncbi:hypothetical protein [Gemmatimonas aurantiaca]|uniref:hypothetical protein n=1 Tax=Gemmatimonas aurantiaca TaxID=173480 RepID=UPI00301BC487
MLLDDSPPTRNLLQTSEDDRLWRVFPSDRALQLFSERKNVLVAPRKWDDPFENFLSRCRVQIGEDQFATLAGLTHRFYGQCWCHSEPETDATWRIYAPGKVRGMRLKVRAGALFDTIYRADSQLSAIQCFLGRVEYQKEDSIHQWLSKLNVGAQLLTSDGLAIAKTLLLKRTQFSHEMETRLLFDRHTGKQGCSDIFKFDCDPNELVEHILLDPRWSKEEAQVATQQLRCVGYQGTIEHSTLYSVPQFADLAPLAG